MNFGADWYAVALSEGLEAGTSAGTRLFDQEIVVWRDTEGVAHAWEDRCPHRGMRLSFGFVRGNHIACLYHGWQYDAGGQCRLIPAHPELKVPDTIRTTAYPCRERLGLVWIYSDLAAVAPPDLPSERQVTPVRSIYIDRAPDVVVAFLTGGDLPPFPAAAAGRATATSSGSLLSLSFGADALLAAVQPVGRAKTALHLAMSGRPQDWRGAGQKAVAHWALELRHALEQRAPQDAASVAQALHGQARQEMVP
jgi:nitrite reductase/ring-hydroxylating ferredoxin subunit